MNVTKPKICIVITMADLLDLMAPDFYGFLAEKGYDVYAISDPGPEQENVRRQGATVLPVPMTRSFTPFKDLLSLKRLHSIFKKERFSIINYSTPKAAFLSAVAGKAAGQSTMIYTLRGLGYTEFSGLKRQIGRFCEKIACKNAQKVIAISQSLKKLAIKEGLAPAEKIEVLGKGSSRGVDTQIFSNSPEIIKQSRQIRDKYNINADDIVIGYAGRLTNEKGLRELFAAFESLAAKYGNLRLMLVGKQDVRNPLNQVFYKKLVDHDKIHVTGPIESNEMPAWFAAMDIVTLPSYREGFGNVTIEASAMQKPVIASDIAGCQDSLIDNRTGLLVEVKNPDSLTRALDELIANPEKRRFFGENGRKFVCENFDRKIVYNHLLSVYNDISSDAQKDL